jgi:succinate dehydrogenase / fumarate reductase flavoprotein subunit
VPKDPGDTRPAHQIPEDDRDYYLERRYPAFGNLVPRDVASRNAKTQVDEGRGVGPRKNGVYLDFSESIERLGKAVIEERYGNLFQMYERITDDDPYVTPMRIYPAVHYTMGGLWVDYNLMSNLPGLYVLGEANFSDHGANRRGAAALMQGRADGYFVLPYTIGDYLAGMLGQRPVPTDDPVFKESEAAVGDQVRRLLSINGSQTVDQLYRKLGVDILWTKCGMARNEQGLKEAISDIRALRDEFWTDVRITDPGETMNQSLEKAGRVADFFELAELLCVDALHREESCGGHFREEHQTPDGEALRNDDQFAYVAGWEWTGENGKQRLNKEELVFEYVKLAQRSYK